jgi:hypothetical protein
LKLSPGMHLGGNPTKLISKLLSQLDFGLKTWLTSPPPRASDYPVGEI